MERPGFRYGPVHTKTLVTANPLGRGRGRVFSLAVDIAVDVVRLGREVRHYQIYTERPGQLQLSETSSGRRKQHSGKVVDLPILRGRKCQDLARLRLRLRKGARARNAGGNHAAFDGGHPAALAGNRKNPAPRGLARERRYRLLQGLWRKAILVEETLFHEPWCLHNNEPRCRKP